MHLRIHAFKTEVAIMGDMTIAFSATDWRSRPQSSRLPSKQEVIFERTSNQSSTRDYPAILAALQLPWSNGLVEGHFNRLKFLKRQMFGRATFGLLRFRVLSYCG
jgi:transposase